MRRATSSAPTAIAVVLAFAAPALAERGERRARVEAITDETEQILEDKIVERQELLRARVRAAYKRLRTTGEASWVDASARASSLRWASAVRRILRRDRFELEQLEAELDTVRSERVLRSFGPHREPEPQSLAAPLARVRIARRFGTRRERGGNEIVRRGLELHSGGDTEVRAPEAGTVVFVGELGTLGETIVIDHGGFDTVLGRLRDVDAVVGDVVEREQRLAIAANPWLHFEVRVDGLGPIDPRPLIE